MKMTDPIVAGDLDAYVDDQLDVGRRIEVEAYLSEHPEAAARVMADLRVRGELRLALARNDVHGRAETREAARRLQGALSNRRLFRAMQRMAAAVALVSLGWTANAYLEPFSPRQVVASVPVPAFVEEAVRAHSTAMLREQISRRAISGFDPAEVRAATGIVMPELPQDWDVTDMQIFPSAFGPSVEMAILRDDQSRLSLFAVRPGRFSVQPVTVARIDGTEASYWQAGEVAYALVANDGDSDIQRQAEQLAKNLY
nr:transcriptional regulator (anti-sigma factor) [Rhizobium sp. Q54]